MFEILKFQCNLLLANIRILSGFFFLLLVTLSSFFIIPVVREKTKVKHGSVIPIGAPTRLTDVKIQTPPLLAERTIKILSI